MKPRSIALGLLVVGWALLPPPLAAENIREQAVHFHAGATSATLPGRLRGDETVDYRLAARAGQTMDVTLKTNNGANYFNVLPPGSETAIGRGDTSGNAWTGELPVDGDYIVRVYLMRSAARRNESANYTLTVGITGGSLGAAPAGDAKVAGTPYHAQGPVPCSVGTDPKGSAQCSFAVIRGASGNAEVHLAPPGYDVILHPDKVETVLIFHGKSVTSRDPSQQVTAEKVGYDWLIGINNFRFYTIPEAVIVGG
jgi:hypothetical protein